MPFFKAIYFVVFCVLTWAAVTAPYTTGRERSEIVLLWMIVGAGGVALHHHAKLIEVARRCKPALKWLAALAVYEFWLWLWLFATERLDEYAYDHRWLALGTLAPAGVVVTYWIYRWGFARKS